MPSGSSGFEDLSRPPLRVDALRRALTGPAGWRSLDVVASTGSTNADLAGLARAGGPHGHVLVAEHQTAGRGRLGRTWTAPPRAGLAVSVLLRPAPPASLWGWLPLLAGVAMVEALVRVAGLPARLKWPNDVLVPTAGSQRKVCGVLAEIVTGAAGADAVVLGAGLNVSLREGDLPTPESTSLWLAGAATTDRDTVLRAYLRALAVRYADWSLAGGDARGCGLAAAYREACSTIGRAVQVTLPGGRVLAGIAEGVDDDGRLLVAQGGSALIALAAGDVLHLRPAGHQDGPATSG